MIVNEVITVRKEEKPKFTPYDAIHEEEASSEMTQLIIAVNSKEMVCLLLQMRSW